MRFGFVALSAGCVCLATFSLPAVAQDRNFLGLKRSAFDDPIITERPTFSASAVTLPQGRFQVEGGFYLPMTAPMTVAGFL